MSIHLTDTAKKRIQHFLASDASKTALRFGVKKTGCSGWGYVIDMAVEAAANDVLFEDAGVPIVVDKDSLALIDGTTIDFIEKPMGSHFVFNNPNVTAECGCGESFTTTAEHA